MPDSFGKRNRDRVKASKAAARDERRVARNQRQKDRLTGDGPDAFTSDQAPQDGDEGTAAAWDPDAARSGG